VASLTLIEPFGVRVPYESELDRYLARGINPLTVATLEAYENLLAFLFETVPAMPEPVRRHRAREAVQNRDFYLKMWPQIRGGDRAHLLDLLLPETRKDLLVVQGQKSKVIHPATVEVIKTMVRSAATAVIPDCGHFPAVERPDETAEHVLGFLRGTMGSQRVETA
jgi:pimeloyl-ACP methyl ester carboxylesterase